MPSKLHRCPQCHTVGKVNRSKPRGIGEKLRMRLIPVYRVYRCHNCNWRGWLLRSSASPATTRLIVGGYILFMLILLLGITLLIIKYWPVATYKY